ncbi:Piwi-domain-containing protein [Rhizophagus irregularis]|uniref:Piwi-domain-containing protein n=1 Tax=Rhizophagus irregularis TaxID=588596 RepID=A0A2I1HPB5_9GLOM|nr:Piwi-domain-containing protein [Rhizophagus irregularis]
MNIIIRHEISAKYPTLRNPFYTPQGATSLREGIEAWQGWSTYSDGSKILGLRSPNDLRRGLSDMERQKVEKRIKNLRINDNHRPENKRKFKIEKLTQTSASDTMLDVDNSNKINVETYFQNKYRRLLYPFLPCIIARKNIHLPIEFCDVIPEQRYMRKLDRDLSDKMTNFARQNPTIRANRIQTGLNILNYQNNEYLKQFGMEVSNNMAVVNARILPTPTIQYHQSSRESRVRPNCGSWNLRDKKVINGATLSSWSVLAFLSYKDLPDQAIKLFVRELITTCQDTGMNISERDPPICRANPIGDTKESLQKAWLKARDKAWGAKPQLILCILPNTGLYLYAEIKRISDTVIGIATQCIQSKHTNKPVKQYCANVCLKMNIKLGGENSFLIPEYIQFLVDEPTILMGASVTHPLSGNNEGPSYAALCSSVNVKASCYAASIRVQSHTDILTDLANMVKESLKTFYQACGLKPKKILFYRNGVSKSQFMYVLESELAAIKYACQSLEADYRPTITFVVIQKRHHTHLLSHAGLHGTSRPTYYQVLYDENGFDANRQVPPVYYARLAATRARLYSFSFRNTDTESSEGVAINFGAVEGLQKVN